MAQSDIYESYAIININNSGNTYYDLQATTGNTDFNGANFGTFYPGGNSLILNGAQNKVYKCGTDDIKDGWFYYRIYKTTDVPPVFSSGQTIFWKSDDGSSGKCSPNEVDQTWESSGAGINVLTGLTPGTYFLEMYTSANFTYTGGSGTVTDVHYANNGGSNYKATFTVAANCINGVSISPTSLSSLCLGAASPTLTATISTESGAGAANISYEWFSNTVNNNTTGTAISGTLLNTTTATTTNTFSPPTSAAGTAYYYCKVTNTDPTCGGSYVTDPVGITVNPNNTAGTPSSTPTLCINTALTNITIATTGATGIGAATGLPAGVTASWNANTITISGTPTTSGTFNYSIPLTGGCANVSASGTITVNPNNTAAAPSSSPTLCINTALSNITIATTGATGIGAATGLPAGVTASWNANTITISGTPTASGTFNYSIPLTGGCSNVSATGTITVNPNNTAGIPSSTPTLCINTALSNITIATTGATGIGTPTGLPAGVTASWNANTITISGTPTASGTFNYSIPLTGGCSNVNATGTITVNPNNTAGIPSSTPTLCINTALSNITIATTGATGIGAATGLPAGVTASWNANTITISGTPTASGTFNYSIPLTGGCANVSATGTITVNPNNTAGIPSSTPTLCINTALSNITIATTGATGIGAATGLPTGVTASWNANTITISGTPTASGTFNYSIPLTGGCSNVSATGTITVNPNNKAGIPTSTPTLCINTALTNITIATTGATGIGTPTGLPAGVTASWNANTITISGTPTASGTFNYTIPLTGGCSNVSATGTITVNPNNTAGSPSSNPTLCINTPLTNITIATTGATGIGAATGLPAGVTASWNANTITISGTPTASGTFNYSIPLTGGCSNVSATGTITVKPNNTAGSPSSNPTLCINTPLTSITIATTGATGIGAATGLPAGVTASWNANTITINGTPTASGTFNYSIPLTGGCSNVSATGTITVNPNNTAGSPSSNPTLCINTPLTSITIATTGATGIGAATGLPAGVTASWNANTITISGTPTASGTFNYSIPLTGGCSNVNATGKITVNPLPTATITPSGATTFCAGGSVTLTSGIATSYQWSTGATTQSINVTTSGSYTVRVTNANGCQSAVSAPTAVIVDAIPAAYAGTSQTVLRGQPTQLGTTAVAGNTYSWTSNPTGFSSSVSNPSVSPMVNTTYTLIETTSNASCSATHSVTLTVKDSLSITKTINEIPTKPGDVIKYQIGYTNVNPYAVAENVVVKDSLPSLFTAAGLDSLNGGNRDPNNPQIITWMILSLPKNTQKTITITGIAGSLGTNFGYNPSSYYMGKGNGTYTISNNASISNPGAGTIYINSPVATTVQQYCGSTLDPDMTTGIINVNSFNEIYYLFTLTNTGNITDSFTLEIDTTFYPGAGGGTKYFNLGNWNITSIYGSTISGTPWLQPGQKFSFLVYIKSDKGYQTGDTSLTNIVSTSYVGGCVKKATTTTIIGDASSNSTDKPDLTISKSATPSTITVGSQFNYTLTITNVTPLFPAPNGFVVKDTIIPGLKYISSSSSSNVTVETESRPGPFGDTTIITATKHTAQSNGAPEIITIIVEPTCYAVPFVVNKAYVNMISYTKKVKGSNIQVVDVNNSNDTSSVLVTVRPNINAPSVPWQSVCFNSTATLTASGAGSGFNYKWYDAPTGGNLLQKDGSYTIASLSKPSDSVYAEIYNTSNPVCASARTKVKVTARNYWLGKTSTNWNTGSNWSDGNVASMNNNSCPDVYVPQQANQPTLNDIPIPVRDIYIYSGAKVTVDGTGKLQISRNILNTGNGLNVINTGAVEFNGGSAQNISSSMFTDTTISNLIVSNSNGVTVSGTGNSIAITGKLSVGSSGVINTGDNVTLKSSINGTASLGTVSLPSQVNGKFVVERYINIDTGTVQHKKAWLFIAPNTHGQTIKESWMENGNNTIQNYGINITGPEGSAGGWDNYSPAPAIKFYVPATGQGSWQGASGSGVALDSQPAWMVFVRGDRRSTSLSSPAYNTTLRSKGTVFTGDKTVTVPAIDSGFFALGNPYPSSVDVRNVDGIDTTGTFYIWNPNFGGIYGLGAYQTFTYITNTKNYESVPTSDTTYNYIQSGQAFFVQSFASSYDITFQEQDKADFSQNKAFFRGSRTGTEKISTFRSNIYTSDSLLLDGTLQMFSPEYSDLVDRSDARKMLNSGINLSVKVDNKLLVVERRQPITQADTIYFNLTGTANGKYSFAFDAKNFADPGLNAWLEDAFTKGRTPVNMNGITNISFDVTSAAASKAANRFKIVFATAEKVALPVTFVKVEAVNEGPQVNVKWKVANEINLSKYVVMKSTDGNNFTDLTDVPANGGTDYFALDKNPVSGYNYYRIRSVDRDGGQGYSEIAKVWMGNNKPLLSVFPNPVVNGIVNLRFENMPSGKYLIRLLNPSGQVILNNSLNFTGGNYNEKIPWNYQMAHGSYQLEITRPDGSVKTIIVMY